MSLLGALGGSILGKIAEKVGGLFNGTKTVLDLLPDSAEKSLAKVELLKAENEIVIALGQMELERDKARDALRTAEVTSENWLTSAYRPLAVLLLVFIVVLNYALMPMFGKVPIELPEPFWWMVGALVGVKFAGRSIEKVAKTQNGA